MSLFAAIDTNVLVSALLSSSDDAATVQVVRLLLTGELTPVYSEPMMKEYREVLLRKKFGFSVELVDLLLSSIERFGVYAEPAPSGIVLPDLKDLPFYEVVLEKRDVGAYLVTGNIKHFPKQPFVVTPREMLEIVRESLIKR
ncbi:MAG: PIN domain-containing protein [Clostridia bacterium]|nr:PIN domain-containing protein [Clostridia bacterium]